MNGKPAPIAVFAFNRPDHLRRALDSLMACDGFDAALVTVFVDGPRHGDEAQAVEASAAVAREVLGPAASVRARASNQGLARSIMDGVGELVRDHGRVIVIEDDLELAPCFLTFMNEALSRFEHDERVYQVSGHMFDVPELRQQPDAMFLPLTTTWGWGTWARAWAHFDPLAAGWERMLSDRRFRRRFNFGGVYDYSVLMRRQMRGRADSWGIRWYWSVFRRDGLSLFPPRSLVRNLGQDGSGTHGRGMLTQFSGTREALPSEAPELPDRVEVLPRNLRAAAAAIWKQNGGWPGWAYRRLRGLTER
jgi:hypothetical protein